MTLEPAEIKEDCYEEAGIPEEQANVLRNRLFLLCGKNRIIMSMYLENGISYRQIALLLGVSPSSILRRIKKVSQTMGIYILCLKNQQHFTRTEMSIARDYFLRGLSIRQIARKKNASYYHIREKVIEIRDTARTFRKELI
ncbi:MAG: hypothetical protein P8016_01525 [Sedimentisphaerales bacterium]